MKFIVYVLLCSGSVALSSGMVHGQPAVVGKLNEAAACAFSRTVFAYEVPDATVIMTPKFRSRLSEIPSLFGTESGVRSFRYSSDGVSGLVATKGRHVLVYELDIEAKRLPIALRRISSLEEVFGRTEPLRLAQTTEIACDEFTLRLVIRSGVLQYVHIGIAADLD